MQIRKTISKVWHQIVVRNFVLAFFAPLIKILSRIEFKNKNDPQKILKIAKALLDAPIGSFIVSKQTFNAASMLIPSEWTHCAIKTGKNEISEVTSKGLVFSSIVDFCESKNHVAVHLNTLTMTELAANSILLEHFLGKEISYDWFFQPTNYQLYCAEFVANFCNYFSPNFIDAIIIMGVETYLPDQFSSERFDCVFDSRYMI